ncbi:hybrid sensor histidine kinase/response regulator [Arenimonas fontis]|uniref:histidine kinase n=1 Tax=Arenimonas fontis TaxID=2608255 RepID=A0A5B2ZAV3_9GAMM|nr:hybrid sensor histidine kinase/response regulator [Arenimonas fontis]KAA2285179.1 response regulator [Arenimonas fontis]
MGVPALAGAILGLWLLSASAQAMPASAWPRLQEIGTGQGLPSNRVRAILRDHEAYMWVATDDGLARHDGTRLQMWRRGRDALPGNELRAMRLEADGRLWLEFDDAGPGWLSADRRRFTPAASGQAEPRGPRAQPRVRDLLGALWIGGPGGLRGRDPGADWRDWSAHPQLSGAVTALALDGEGGVWIGSADHGAFRLPPAWRGVGGLPLPAAEACDARPTGVATASADALWVAAGPCLWHLRLGAGRAHWQRQALPPERTGEPIRLLEADAEGRPWLLRGNRLWHVPATGPARAWKVPDSTTILPGAEAIWLLAADGRVWRLHADTDAGPSPLSPPMPVERLFAGPDGQPWALTDAALWRWRADAGRWRRVPGDAGPEALALAAGPDRLLAFDGARLWQAGWTGDGLAPWRPLPAGPDMPDLGRAGLALDEQGRPWLTGMRGLWFPADDAGDLRPLAAADGLPMPLHPLAPRWLHGAGLAVLPGAEGLVLISPRRLASAPRVPAPLRLELSYRHGERLVSTPAGLGLLSLGPEDTLLGLRLHRLSYGDPSGHRYRVQLEGLDAGPVLLGPQGERVFPPLPPGRYRLTSAAAPAGSTRWRDGPTVTVLVEPAWWHSREALVLAVLGGVGLLGFGGSVWRRRQRRREIWRAAHRRRREAERHSEAKSRFLAMLGHEIRTPLTGVLGMAELLQAEPLSPRQRERLEALQAAGRHLLRLVNDSLDLARIEAGRLSLERAPFDLHALAEDVAGLLAPLARAKGLAFRLQVPAGTPVWWLGDAMRVRQILLNLGHNAVKFCDHGGVSLQLSAAPGGGLRAEMRDTGPGLAPAQRARLFRRFEQGGGSRAPSGGSGLGLAISQELAIAMGGRILVYSEPGHGACFEVLLPLPEAEAPAQAQGPESPGTARRVLLVEDDEVVATVVCELLRTAGHEVIHVPHGLAALAELEGGGFSLVLLDLDLPGMDGLALSRLLRARGDDTPRVALTARTEAGQAAGDAGMAGFLRKPVTGDDLRDAVRRWARGSDGTGNAG